MKTDFLLTRRGFMHRAGAGLFVLGASRNLSWAQSATQSVLSGTEFDLQIGEAPVNFTGNSRIGTVVNGQVPAPLLRWREGDTITLRVANRLRARSSIHWHGMIVPADMDGVPGLSFEGIPSGGEYVYRFKVNQYGTYWYHSHSRFQEQTGLYGPIVIERRGGERQHADREYVVHAFRLDGCRSGADLRDTQKAERLLQFRQANGRRLLRRRAQKGWERDSRGPAHVGQMRMNPTDCIDVSGYTYTYLMNGVDARKQLDRAFQSRRKECGCGSSMARR